MHSAKIHLAVSRAQTRGHRTLDEFLRAAGKGKVSGWTATKKFVPGDVVLFHFGEPAKSILGVGFVASETWDEKGEFYWTNKPIATFSNFKPVLLLENPVSLERAAQLAGLQDWYSSSPYRSSRLLDPKIARTLITQMVRTNPEISDFLNENHVKIRKPKGLPGLDLIEGGVQEVTIELRKRNPKLRAEAIAEYGYRCQVCGFDVEDFYGEIGGGYIEVHHLRPLSEHKQERLIAMRDVAVVCANCQRVRHRSGKKPFPIEKLRKELTSENGVGENEDIASHRNWYMPLSGCPTRLLTIKL